MIKQVFDDRADEPITYMGFKICETYSIDYIHEIEVFRGELNE